MIDDLVDVYTIFTGKRVTINGLLFKPNSSLKKTEKETVKETKDEKEYKTKLASPTLESIILMMNKIKEVDPSYVNGDRAPWFTLISAGLGAVRTHGLD